MSEENPAPLNDPEVIDDPIETAKMSIETIYGQNQEQLKQTRAQLLEAREQVKQLESRAAELAGALQGLRTAHAQLSQKVSQH